MDHFLHIISKSLTDHSGIGQTDARNPKAVDQLRKGCLSGRLHALHDLLVGFLPEPIHFFDLFFITVQMEQIIKIFDKSAGNEFLQCCLRHSVQIHGIPAHKQCK